MIRLATTAALLAIVATGCGGKADAAEKPAKPTKKQVHAADKAYTDTSTIVDDLNTCVDGAIEDVPLCFDDELDKLDAARERERAAAKDITASVRAGKCRDAWQVVLDGFDRVERREGALRDAVDDAVVNGSADELGQMQAATAILNAFAARVNAETIIIKGRTAAQDAC